MTHCMKIPKENTLFYSEAYRAKSIEEINESAGLKHLISREVDRAYNLALACYKDKLDLKIVEDYDGFVIELKEVM